MWTYLVIFLSLVCLVIIFARRLYLVLIKKKTQIAPPEIGVQIEEENRPEKKRILRDDKVEMRKLYDRSLALIKKGLPKDAVKTLVKALAINPDFLEAQKELGRLYMDQKLWLKAAAIYKDLAVRTNDPVDFSHLGLSLYNSEDLEGAVNAYQSAINLDPERSQRYISLGQVYKDLGKGQLALIAFNKAVEFDAANADYWLLAADINLALKNFLDARGALNKVFELAPMSKIARKMLKDLENAEKAWREANPAEGK